MSISSASPSLPSPPVQPTTSAAKSESALPPYTAVPTLSAVQNLIKTIPGLICLYIHASW